MKFKKIIDKYEDKFDELIEEAEKIKKDEIYEKEKKIKQRRKRLKKIERFLLSKAKFFDFEKIDLIIHGKNDLLGYSKEKGIYVKYGTHKNFNLRQCLSLFKNTEEYLALSDEVIKNADDIFEHVLNELKKKLQ